MNLSTPLATLLFFLLLNLTHTASAQGMSEEQMQQMMQNAQKMQECFGNIDESAYKELEAKGRQMESEIKALCDAGKRDEAMTTAMKYGMEMQNDPQIQQMRKCGEMMKDMMAGMPQPYIPNMPTDDEEEMDHICDGM